MKRFRNRPDYHEIERLNQANQNRQKTIRTVQETAQEIARSFG
jgi:hypothetical protein